MAKTTMARQVACAGLLLLGGFWAGGAFHPETAAKAGVRKTPPREAFLAGSERALSVLQDISETLKRIDARLMRIEKAVDQATSQ